MALNDTIRTLFSKFSDNANVWNSLLYILSQLDILCSFAIVSSEGDNRGEMCRPEFINSDKPIFDVRDSRHPCVIETFSKSDFISNDISLGINNNSKCMLLTGPNMGGKSTILRQACILEIIAHIGCYVPASSCKLTPIDRIFTRIGASDKILAGQSTFFVEMSETSTILSKATSKSLVIIDELGRGTSTYDGTAIAYSSLKYIAEKIGCITLFSTHYHSLVEDFSNNSNIKLQHMSCMIDNEDEDEKIVFLYKLTDGSCPRSYGMNVARIAKLPDIVISKAKEKSIEFENKVREGKEYSYVDLINKYKYDITAIRELKNEIKQYI